MISRSLFTRYPAEQPVPVSTTATIPTERVVNLLARLCKLEPDSTVLEIGTGSGYQAAVLAGWCNEVVSVEVQPQLQVSEKLPCNVTLVHADGCTYDSGEQFDAVLVTFAAPEIMPVWTKQLKDGGRLVIPQGTDVCAIAVYEKRSGELVPLEIAAYGRFTPRVRV